MMVWTCWRQAVRWERVTEREKERGRGDIELHCIWHVHFSANFHRTKPDEQKVIVFMFFSAVQTWLPEVHENGNVRLVTKGMPFCVAGTGDLLALFRCISCRFTFGTDINKPEELGAPGRVFLSGEAELACNVQEYPREAYLRRAEAEQCRIQSSMMLPIFSLESDSTRDAPIRSSRLHASIAVVEVVQTSDDMAFMPVAELLRKVLHRSGLTTVDTEEIRDRVPTTTTHLHLPDQTGVLGKNSSEERGRSSLSSHQKSDESDSRPSPDDGAQNKRKVGKASGIAYAEEGNVRNVKNRESAHLGRKMGRGSRAGADLTLRDLQNHFGLGLKEAASALGICTTTLKRACRRHGIQRWPRRALQKVSKALDDIEKRGDLQKMYVHDQCLAHDAMGGPSSASVAAAATTAMNMDVNELMPSSQGLIDTRWNTLATLIPHLKVPNWLHSLPPQQGTHAPADSVSLPEGAVAIDKDEDISHAADPAPMIATDISDMEEHPCVVEEGKYGNRVMAKALHRPRARAEDRSKQVAANIDGREHAVDAANSLLVSNNDYYNKKKSNNDDNNNIDHHHHQEMYTRLTKAVLDPPFLLDEKGQQQDSAIGHSHQVPSVEPGFSLPSLSDMSFPSFDASLLNSISLGIERSFEQNDGPEVVSSGAEQGSAPDDVGLLDSTVLELMLFKEPNA